MLMRFKQFYWVLWLPFLSQSIFPESFSEEQLFATLPFESFFFIRFSFKIFLLKKHKTLNFFKLFVKVYFACLQKVWTYNKSNTIF